MAMNPIVRILFLVVGISLWILLCAYYFWLWAYGCAHIISGCGHIAMNPIVRILFLVVGMAMNPIVRILFLVVGISLWILLCAYYFWLWAYGCAHIISGCRHGYESYCAHIISGCGHIAMNPLCAYYFCLWTDFGICYEYFVRILFLLVCGQIFLWVTFVSVVFCFFAVLFFSFLFCGDVFVLFLLLLFFFFFFFLRFVVVFCLFFTILMKLQY